MTTKSNIKQINEYFDNNNDAVSKYALMFRATRGCIYQRLINDAFSISDIGVFIRDGVIVQKTKPLISKKSAYALERGLTIEDDKRKEGLKTIDERKTNYYKMRNIEASLEIVYKKRMEA